MDPVLLSTAAAGALAGAWALTWNWRYRHVLRHEPPAVAFADFSDAAQAELRTAAELQAPELAPRARAPKLPSWVSVETAAMLDGVGLAYAHWTNANAATVLAEEYARAVADAFGEIDKVLQTHFEVFARVVQDGASFAHHALNPSLWTWLDSVGGTDFVHLLAEKFAAIDAAFHGDIGLDIGGQVISPAIPWITVVVSSAKEALLLIGGKTTPLRAIAHIALDTTLVAGGVFAGAAGAGAVGLIFAALDVALTGGVMTALTAIFGVAAGLAGAKAAGRIKAWKLEECCAELARASAEFDARAEALRAQEEPRVRDLTARLNAELRAQTTALRLQFEADRRARLADHVQGLDRFSAHLPQQLARAADEARSDLAAATAARRRLGVGLLLDLRAGPAALARERRCAISVVALTGAERALSESAGSGFDRAWPIARDAAMADPHGRLWPVVQDIVERQARFRQGLEAMRGEATGRMAAIEASIRSRLDAAKAAIAAEAAAILDPLGVQIRSLFQQVEVEAAALGHRTSR